MFKCLAKTLLNSLYLLSKYLQKCLVKLVCLKCISIFLHVDKSPRRQAGMYVLSDIFVIKWMKGFYKTSSGVEKAF